MLTSENLLPLVWTAVLGLLVAIVALICARLARAAALRALARSRADASTILLIGRVVFIAVVTLGVLTALGILGVPWGTILALTSVLGLAASLALQDVLKNFVAGLYLLVERPFRIGESIKVRDFVGAVETINVRTTVLRMDDGIAVVVPNAMLFSEIILNRGVPRAVPPPSSGVDPSPV